MTARIRPARPDDADALARMEAATFDPVHYDSLLSAARFRHHARNPSAALGVAAGGDDVPLGYALVLFRRGSDAGRFYSLAISAAMQGHGLGHALFDWAEAETVRRGRHRLNLEIREDNATLLQRYSRRGYVIYRRVDDYYPDGAAALKMFRRLDTPA
ncbi:GNAT family N-acetyltransferase [Chiayiivirga flava]|uniref:Ribosomal protein S18 acetylase RimI-like enzyme n=1 Tax=Chiayiivirga flava TaxID=659595 RepID=A0A7W8FYI3_9GAMM|nr:GNAT family N-acetyltransferase [Chiayiivirga flava]MBB5207427.1 ribosomal protein S18 acetylase RimI-like enzyme [Chiayiivirga flava]